MSSSEKANVRFELRSEDKESKSYEETKTSETPTHSESPSGIKSESGVENRSSISGVNASWAFRRQSRLLSIATHTSVIEESLPSHPRRRAFAAIALTEDATFSISTGGSREEASPLGNKPPLQQINAESSSLDKEEDEKGNEAEDEDDEVFAAASRTRRRSRIPSNSFELTASSYNRNRQLKLLRTVHSAQARLQKSNKNPTSSSFRTPSIVLSVDEIEEPIRHPNYKNRIISPSPSLKVEVDEEDFYRLGGRRLSKLGSQTFDYGDELQEDEGNVENKGGKMKSAFKKENSFSTTFTNFASSFLPSRLVNRGKASPTDASSNKKHKQNSSSERPLDFVECNNRPLPGTLGLGASTSETIDSVQSTKSLRKKSICSLGMHSASVSSASPSTVHRPSPPVNNRRGSAFFEGTSASFCVSELTPPSIVCTEHDDADPEQPGTEEGSQGSIPILDEFAQFLNASIHPPNELSVPRCYPEQPGVSQTAPGSRRGSTSSRGAALSIPYRNSRSLSLGYSQQSQGPTGPTRSTVPSNSVKNHHPPRGFSRGLSLGGSSASNNSGLSPTNRPVLRRESAQDIGDEETGPRPHPTLPDLKIDLPPGETEDIPCPTPSSLSAANEPPSSGSGSNSNPSNRPSLNPDPPVSHRRHSNCMRGNPRQITRNKSAPATPLNRSLNNVMRISRSPSRDAYLMVPCSSNSRRIRGSSLPESRDDELYCLRQFTVSNKRVVNRGDSLQPRHCRSNSSICSSGSSLSYSHSGPSGRSSLRSSTEDDEGVLSRDGSLGGPGGSSRYTVLMLGAGDVGKTLLTSQFMSSNDVGAYVNDGQDEEYGEKYVSVLLEGEESELVFIDRPYSEMSVENAIATYVPDAMIVVYSVVNKDSLETADSILQYLWRTGSNTDKAVIMVGNKSDLVRSRVVPIVDAKAIATSYDCKYTETSATLNHNVDELLVGALTQIRLKLAERQRFMRKGGRKSGIGIPPSLISNSTLTVQSSSANIRRKSAGTRVKGILDKVLKGDSKSKSCDDLHVL